MSNSIDTLYISLENAHLSPWQPVIDVLLKRFEGIEDIIIDEDQLPVESLQRLLRQIQAEPNSNSDELLVAGISHADFFRYRARQGTSKWNPLEQSLKVFKDGADNQTIFWEDVETYPHPRQIQRWLEDLFIALRPKLQ